MFVHTAYLSRILLIQSPVLLAWLESNLSTGKVLTGTPVEVFALNRLNTPQMNTKPMSLDQSAAFKAFLMVISVALVAYALGAQETDSSGSVLVHASSLKLSW